MHMPHLTVISGLAVSLLLSACSSDGGSSCDPVDLGLEGTWVSNCVAQDSNYRVLRRIV
jgi:hypothetical protein